MLNICLDKQGAFQVVFPSNLKRADVIILTKKYLAQEQTLPAKKQNLFTPIIQDLLQQILDCEKKIAEGEAQRAVAADAAPKLEQRSKELVSSMLKTIAAAYPDRPAKAQEWALPRKRKRLTFGRPEIKKSGWR